MNRQFFIMLLRFFILSWFLSIITVASSWGVSTFVVGGKEHPWETSYSKIVVIDFKATLGWIQPVQLDPTKNLALETYARGGSVISPNTFADVVSQLKGIVNGDSTVAFERKSTEAVLINPLGVLVDLDLGARLGVNRIRFFPRNTVYHTPSFPFQEDYMRGYAIYLNDGTEETSIGGQPLWKLIKRNDNNDHPIVDELLSLQYVRYIRVESTRSIGWEIDELQVFGEGFVPEASYESQVFDFGQVTTWGELRWVERRMGDPLKSSIEVRTRSGDDETPLVYNRIVQSNEEVMVRVTLTEYRRLKQIALGPIKYFTKAGLEVSQEEYNALRADEQGRVEYFKRVLSGENVPFDKNGNPLTESVYKSLPSGQRGVIVADREHWSAWSSPYPVGSEVPIISPGPRRYIQIRIDLKSMGLRSGGAVDSLSFTFSQPPVAEAIVAEISPQTTIPVQTTMFTYAVKPTIHSNDTGFDRLEITTPARIIAIRSVTIDGAEVQFGEELVTDDRFVVSFPKITQDRLLMIVFDGIVLRAGTVFSGRAFDSQTGELPQGVVGGDATPDLKTNDLVVNIAVGGKLIRSVSVQPNCFTPNGDGITDLASVSYDILQLAREVPVSVRIYDLAGRLVRTLYAGHDSNGRYLRVWNGTDDNGRIVPPGLYSVQITVETDSGTERQATIVCVVY